MSHENLLFRLPNAWLVHFLSVWLDIVDVGRLDSAMTNEQYRPIFLQCLQEMRNITVDGLSFGGNGLLSWISIRQIHVEMLTLLSFEDIKELIKTLYLPSLRKLVIYLSYRLLGSEGYTWLHHVPQLCPLLEVLSVDDLNTMADVDDLVFLCSQCLHLKIISFDWITCTNDILSSLQQVGNLIVEIRHAWSPAGTTAEDFKNFLTCCPQMRKLGYHRFEDDGELLMCVAQFCPGLEDIKFDECSTPALLELSRNCRQLRKVKIAQDSIVGQVLSVSGIKLLQQIDSLEELSLCECSLTDEKLAVISGFPSIKRLELRESYGIDGLTGAGFRVLEGSRMSKTLQSISVEFTDGGGEEDLFLLQDFDDAGMITGIASCHNLRNIDVSHHCDDAGLQTLSAGCPLLKEIQLIHGSVTVDGLVALAAKCQHLTKVVIGYDYFDRSNQGYDHNRALALSDIAIVRSRFPHIRFDCLDDFDQDYQHDQDVGEAATTLTRNRIWTAIWAMAVTFWEMTVMSSTFWLGIGFIVMALWM